MAETAIRESLRYGGQLFVFFIWVVILGGSGLLLGSWLALPEFGTWTDGGNPDIALFAAGTLVGFAGLAVLCTGLFGLTYKLISDAIANGSTLGRASPPSSETTEQAGPEQVGQSVPATEQSGADGEAAIDREMPDAVAAGDMDAYEPLGDNRDRDDTSVDGAGDDSSGSDTDAGPSPAVGSRDQPFEFGRAPGESSGDTENEREHDDSGDSGP